MVNTAHRDKGKMRVAFDDIHDTLVPIVDAVQCPRKLVPHKPIAVVRARDNEFILWAKEVY